MDVLKLSPKFEDRFSRISIKLREGTEIEPQGAEHARSATGNKGVEARKTPNRGMKKLGSTYSVRHGSSPGNFTTPTRPPILSTAMRAESRSISSQLRKVHNSPSLEASRRLEGGEIGSSSYKTFPRVNRVNGGLIGNKTGSEGLVKSRALRPSMGDGTSSGLGLASVVGGKNGLVESPTPDKVKESLTMQKRVNTVPATLKKRHQNEQRAFGANYGQRVRSRRIRSQNETLKPPFIPKSDYRVPTLSFKEVDSAYKSLTVSPNNSIFNNEEISGGKNSTSDSCWICEDEVEITKRAPPNASPYISKTLDKRRFRTVAEFLRFLFKKNPSLFCHEIAHDTDYKEAKGLEHELVQNTIKWTEGKLSIYERGEVLRKKDLYFLTNRNRDGRASLNDHRDIDLRLYKKNYGFDDESGNYIIVPGDHIDYRYEIDSLLGNGSFGNVVKCRDHKFFDGRNQRRVVALKIIKNDINWSLQAVSEIKILKLLNQKLKLHPDYSTEDFPILLYYDHFNFRSHMCIVTELLSLNLFSLIELSEFRGFSLEIVRTFSKGILKGLQFIHSCNVIHCDIKPENIMIGLPLARSLEGLSDANIQVKIIDFGSSCFDNDISHTYIQSRFYRAPEIIIGANYNSKIDIWSFGCVVAELFSGMPLLPGKNELEQTGLILELFGAPSSSFIINSRNKIMKRLRSQSSIRVIEEEVALANSTNKKTIDEKAVKRTLLFKLFDMNGKTNMQFLNMSVAATAASGVSNHFAIKKSYRLNSKSIEIVLRLHTSDEDKHHLSLFAKFLKSMFNWDPQDRPTPDQLLQDPFLNVSKNDQAVS